MFSLLILLDVSAALNSVIQFSKKIFGVQLTALQCCIIFCCITKVNHLYVYIYILCFNG